MLLVDVYLVFLSLITVGLTAISLTKKKGERQINTPVGYNPKVLVIVPCKGTDLMFEKGLATLKRQSYKNYDIMAVPDSAADPSVKAVKMAKVNYIIKRSSKAGSNKVAAITTALMACKRYDVYVVVDSDTLCSRNWLTELVRPLWDKHVGAVTAYPYFSPIKGAGFWAKVKMVWGFIGNSLMESEKTRFLSGASMAFRRGLLDKKSMEKFSTSISDDIAITRIVKEKGLLIHYVSKKVVRIPSNDSLGSLIEWTNRQTAFSIRAYKPNFRYGIVYYTASALLLYSAVPLTIFYSPYSAVLLLPYVIKAWKTYRRAEKKTADIAVICLFIDLLYLENLISARIRKEIAWRGVRYSLERV